MLSTFDCRFYKKTIVTFFIPLVGKYKNHTSLTSMLPFANILTAESLSQSVLKIEPMPTITISAVKTSPLDNSTPITELSFPDLNPTTSAPEENFIPEKGFLVNEKPDVDQHSKSEFIDYVLSANEELRFTLFLEFLFHPLTDFQSENGFERYVVAAKDRDRGAFVHAIIRSFHANETVANYNDVLVHRELRVNFPTVHVSSDDKNIVQVGTRNGEFSGVAASCDE